MATVATVYVYIFQCVFLFFIYILLFSLCFIYSKKTMAAGAILGVPSNVSSSFNSTNITDSASVTSYDNVSTIPIAIRIHGVLGNTIALIVFSKIKSQKVIFLIASQVAIDLLTSFTIIIDIRELLHRTRILQSVQMEYLFCFFWHFFTYIVYAFCHIHLQLVGCIQGIEFFFFCQGA